MPTTYIPDFKKALDDNFEANLVPGVLSTLANMLAFDYATRLKNNIELDQYIYKCVGKLHRFLEAHVITDDSFSSAFIIFTKLIAPEETDHHEKDNVLEKEQDLMIDALITQHFANANAELQGYIKILLKDSLHTLNQGEFINYIHSEPQVIGKIVADSLKLNQTQEQIISQSKTQLLEIAHKNIAANEHANNFKKSTSMATTAICVLGVVAVSLVSSVTILPLITIPALILSNKIAPTLGETIGNVILNNSSGFQQRLKESIKLKDSIMQQDLSITKQQSKEIAQNKQLENIDLGQFKGVKSHIDQEPTKQPMSKTTTTTDKTLTRGL